MRATYEDLLRTARRIAVDAAATGYPRRQDAVADWPAVVAAVENHLRWLRYRLRASKLYDGPSEQTGRSLGRLAQAIGAASDLLAEQDALGARILDDPSALAAGRAELAAIALIGAEAVMAGTRRKTDERRRLTRIIGELEALSHLNVRRDGLGWLGALTVAGPSTADDALSTLVRGAARWERADESVTLQTLLTRDLRSTTAQIRTACAYVWYLVDQIRESPHAGLEPGQRISLNQLKNEVRSAEGGALRVAESWRRRLSDLDGPTGTPSEAVFAHLKDALDGVVRPHGNLLKAEVLVPDRATAAQLLEVVDEMLWSAEQVGRRQQRAVAALIGQGRLFVPRQELSRYDLRYLRTPANTKLLQSRWLRTTHSAFFAELTSSLAWSVDHLSTASLAARRLVGAAHQIRPEGTTLRPDPAPYFDLPDSADTGLER